MNPLLLRVRKERQITRHRRRVIPSYSGSTKMYARSRQDDLPPTIRLTRSQRNSERRTPPTSLAVWSCSNQLLLKTESKERPMETTKLLVYTNPTADQDEAFNDWCDHTLCPGPSPCRW